MFIGGLSWQTSPGKRELRSSCAKERQRDFGRLSRFGVRDRWLSASLRAIAEIAMRAIVVALHPDEEYLILFLGLSFNVEQIVRVIQFFTLREHDVFKVFSFLETMGYWNDTNR